MNSRPLALLAAVALAALVFSCAGGPDIPDAAPSWAETPHVDTSEAYAFRGTGVADSLALAKEEAISELIDGVVEAMNLGDPSQWNLVGRSVVENFRDRLESVIRTPDYSSLEGVEVVRKEAWNAAAGISYAVDITWEKQAFAAKADELADATGVASPAFRDLENRAREAEIDGSTYEAALIWSAAAGVAEGDSNASGYRQALREVSRVLADLNYQIESIPGEVYVGIRPASPVVFRVSSGNRPVGNAEFVIGYPRSARDGSQETGYARMLSDAEGRLVFRPPIVVSEGPQIVSLAPSATPFLEFLDDSEEPNARNLAEVLEVPQIEAEYLALARARTVPTGVLILETDLAGNPLNSSAAAGGIIDDLLADEFDVSVMPLDPREMISRSNRALLRDLKADTRFSDNYDRVIHGTVSLESFEQDGDSFIVRVSGTLSLSDIQRQVTIYRSEITKTSRAGDGQQAISAAFRQLGRSFAAELIDRAP